MAQMSLADGLEASTSTSGAGAGYELTLNDSQSGGGGKILGSRDFARYYKQNHKPQTSSRQTHLAAVQQRWALVEYKQ